MSMRQVINQILGLAQAINLAFGVMKDKLVLECTRAALIEFQRRQEVMSESVARVVLVVEKELQRPTPPPFTTERVVEGLIMAGLLSPLQKKWAEEYLKHEPEAFWVYVRRNPRPEGRKHEEDYGVNRSFVFDWSGSVGVLH